MDEDDDETIDATPPGTRPDAAGGRRVRIGGDDTCTLHSARERGGSVDRHIA